MMSFSVNIRLTVLCLVLVLSLHGCAGKSPEPHFYHLPSESSESPSERGGEYMGSISLGILLDSFPAYLDRPQIVTRVGDHQIEFSEFHRWSLPLRDDFLAGLTERLRSRLNTESVWSFPFPPYADPDIRVILELIRFDGSLEGDAALICRWAVFKGKGEGFLFQHRTSLREPVAGGGHGSLVAAEGRLVSLLADEIAAVVRSLQ